MNSDIMHLCLIANNGYIRYCYTAVLSIIDNAAKDDKLFVHILTDGMSEENQKLLLDLRNPNCDIEIISPELSKHPDCMIHRYKFLIPTTFSHLDKILYIDCDTIICDSLKPLYETNIQDEYVIAMVKDLASKQSTQRMNLKQDFYCNSGVIVINIDNWNKNDTTEKLFDYASNNKCVYKDQDQINAVLDEKIFLIEDKRYNFICTKNTSTKNDKIELENMAKNACIIHYAAAKPLDYDYKSVEIIDKYFWKYFMQTIWYKNDQVKYTRLLISQEQELKSLLPPMFGLFYNRYKIVAVFFFIQTTLKVNEKNIDKIARWIPNKKWRKNFKAKFK